MLSVNVCLFVVIFTAILSGTVGKRFYPALLVAASFSDFFGNQTATNPCLTLQFALKSMFYSIVTIQITATTIVGRNVKDLSLENVSPHIVQYENQCKSKTIRDSSSVAT